MYQNQFSHSEPGDFTLVYSKAARLGYSALILLLPALFTFLFVMIVREEKSSPWPWLGVVVAAIALAAAGIFDLFKTQLDKKGDRLTYRNILGKKSLEKAEIESFVVLEKHYVIFRAKPGSGKKDLKVNKHLSGLEKLIAWASANLVDEEAEELKAMEELALKSIQGPLTDHQKMEQVQKGRKLYKTMQAVILAVAGWGWFLPFYGYSWLIILLALAPWVVMVFMVKFPGIARFDGVTAKGAPRAVVPIIAATITLGMRGLQDVQLLSYSTLIWLAPLLAAAMAFLLYKLDANPKKKPVLILVMFLFTGAYTYGGLAIANALLDKSQPKFYETVVLKKRASTGRHSSYYLMVEPWGPVPTEKEISVNRAFYEKAVEGQSIVIGVADGALKMPWFWYFTKP